MTKLTDEDLSLWNLYKSNYKSISKKIGSLNNVDILKKKKLIKLSNKSFVLEKKTLKSLYKSQIKIDNKLDLHGLTEVEAKKSVNEFILDSFKNKKRNLIIITGKGNKSEGVLKKRTPTWLQNEDISKFIIGFTQMPKTSGGDGAIFIKIKNISKYSID